MMPRLQEDHDKISVPNDKGKMPARLVVGITSGKGGVGKSLVAALLAVRMNREGYHVGILDADIAGASIQHAFGISQRAEREGNAIVPLTTMTGIRLMSVNALREDESQPLLLRGPMLSRIVREFWGTVAWGELDFLFVDMPPGTGDVALTICQSLPLSGMIVVTTPQSFVGTVVKKTIRMAEQFSVPVMGLVENMSYLHCPGCERTLTPFGTSCVQQLAEEFHLPVLGRLPIEKQYAAACDQGLIELSEGSELSEMGDALKTLLLNATKN